MQNAFVTFAVAVTVAATATTVAAFDCPIPDAVASVGVIKETADDVIKDGRLLAAGMSGNGIGEVIFRLRDEYRGVSDAEIQNYLLTASCPTLAKQRYDDTEFERKLRAFTHAVQEHLAVEQD